LLTPKEVVAKAARIQTRYAARDQRMRDVLSVRQGDISKVYPSMFSEDYPKPLVANFVDVAARDLAEVMAPLPSFNCLPSIVEMDYETNNPRIRLLNPFGVYPELDRFGRTISLVQVVSTDAETLAAQYPEFATQIMPQNRWQQGSPAVSLVRYHDKDQDLIFLPERQNLILANVPNPVGKCLAKQDVQELALGPDAIMRSANPQGIRRVPLELPAGVFTESGVLERELRMGARYPETRSGNIDASVVTGRGVQALQAGFDTQVKAAQAQFARLFTEMVSLCFEVDEKIFGNMTKQIKGSDDGTPYTLKYIPSRDIKGEYGVDVRYGIMSGMDPNRAIIALLQMRSDKLVSRDYVRREIPMELNVTQEEQRVDIEEMRDSLRVAVAQYAQAIPALASQGQDPSQIITRIADVIQGRQKGLQLETIIAKAFAPEPVAPAVPEQQVPVAGVAPAPASQPTPQQTSGAAPAAGQPQPDIAQLLASIGGAA